MVIVIFAIFRTKYALNFRERKTKQNISKNVLMYDLTWNSKRDSINFS